MQCNKISFKMADMHSTYPLNEHGNMVERAQVKIDFN